MVNSAVAKKITVGVLAAVFAGIVYLKVSALKQTVTNPVSRALSKEQSSSLGIVSTNPSPLDQAIVLPNQTVEITFNYPIENAPQFKHHIEPKPEDYKVELSLDRKTVKIIPVKPFLLGATYTLFIDPDTKFDGKKTLNRDYIFHLRTIEYKGI